MKVIQSLNQNALLVCDANKRELIALGRGVGFGKQKGDLVDRQKITSFYRIHSTAQEQKILDDLKGIDENVLVISEEIAIRANKKLKNTLTESFVFSLASHIQFAIEKNKDNQLPLEPFQYEIKYLYPKEYELAKESVAYINDVYHLNFPDSEISFFTLHFVNGLKDTGDFREVVKLSNIMNELIEIIEEQGDFAINKDSVAYSRFIVHLRYFLIRQLQPKESEERVDSKLSELYKTTVSLFSKETKIVEEVKKWLFFEHAISYNTTEDFYLLLHIIRIFEEEKT